MAVSYMRRLRAEHRHRRFEYVTQSLLIGGLALGVKIMVDLHRKAEEHAQILMLLEQITRKLDLDVRHRVPTPSG